MSNLNQLNEDKNIDHEKLWNFLQDGGQFWTKDDTATLFGDDTSGFRIKDEYAFVHGIKRDPPLDIKRCTDIRDLPRIVNEFIDLGGDIDMINNELEVKEILENQLENIDYDWLWQYLGVDGGEISSRNGTVWIGGNGIGTIEVNGEREYGISYCKDITDLPRLVKDFIKVGGDITVINKKLNEQIERQKLREEAKSDVSFISFICGIEPLSGEFFVGTKYVFNKMDPLVCCIPEACDEQYSPAVAEHLKLCLKHLTKLGIKGVVEGELLFTETDKKIKIVNGEKLYIITSNNISYGIPTKSEMGKRIDESKIGLIFHNHYYEGADIEGLLELWEMKPREGMKEDLKDTKDVVVFSNEQINEFNLDVEK